MQYSTIAEETGGGGSQSINWKTYAHLRESAGWHDPALIAYGEPMRARLNSGQTSQEISVVAVSNGFFEGFTEMLDAGQDFSSAWESGHSGREVILSRRLAETLFSTPGNSLHRNVELNNQAFRVIGVAPKNFSGLWIPTDAWVTPNAVVSLEFGPLQGESQQQDEGAWQRLSIFYVLAGSRKVQLERLRSGLGDLVRSPDNLPNHLHATDGLSKDPIWDMKVRFWARLAFFLSIVLIFAAGLNYCGLLLAQAPRYVEEVRLKRVLGASTLRIMVESMSGPVFTVVLGFFVGAWGAISGLWVLGKQLPHFLPVSGFPWFVALPILGAELVIAFMLAFLIAIIPCARLLRDSGAPRMAYTSTTGRKTTFALYGIVSSQIASCILICLVAGTIIGAVRSVSKVELGFDSDHLTAVEIGPASKDGTISFSTGGSHESPFAAFARQVIEDIPEKLREVKYMSAASCAPLAQPMKTLRLQRMDRDSPPRSIHFCGVSQGFFQAMGNPIVEGIGFSSNRFTGDVSEVVINRRLANELWPGENPLHHIVRIDGAVPGLQFEGEVVGVAQDMRFSGLSSTPDATIFLPLKGNVFTLAFPLYFLVKGTESSRSLEELVQRQAEISMPSLGVSTSYRADEKLRQSSMEQEARVGFAIGGAALVAAIAYIGLYGVLVHSVNSKRKEMAIRACFGASAGELRKIIIRQALQCSAAALAISLLAWKPMMALAASAWLGKVDLSWQSAVVIPLLCLTAAAGISLVPASAAAKVSPAEILKAQ